MSDTSHCKLLLPYIVFEDQPTEYDHDCYDSDDNDEKVLQKGCRQWGKKFAA